MSGALMKIADDSLFEDIPQFYSQATMDNHGFEKLEHIVN